MKQLLALTVLLAAMAIMAGCGTSADARWEGTYYSEGLDVDGDGLITGGLDIGGILTTGNIAIGTATMPAGDNATTVAHGLGGTPDFIYLTWASDPGNDPALFWDGADASYFTIRVTTANITDTAYISWLAVRGNL